MAATGKKRSTAGKSKSSTARKTGSRKQTAKKQEDTFVLEVILWIVVALAVLLFISNFGFGGKIGGAVSGFFFGIFGLLAYIFPVIFLIGIFFAVSNKGSTVAVVKLIAGCLFVAFLCMFIQLAITEETVMTVKESYDYAREHALSGGAIGGALTALMRPNFGVAGSYIIDIVVLIIALVLLTERSALRFMEKSGRKMYESAKNENERYQEYASRRREERQEQRQMRQERRRERESESRQRREEREFNREQQRQEEQKRRRMDKKAEGVAIDIKVVPKQPQFGSQEISELNADDYFAMQRNVAVQNLTAVSKQTAAPGQMAAPNQTAAPGQMAASKQTAAPNHLALKQDKGSPSQGKEAPPVSAASHTPDYSMTSAFHEPEFTERTVTVTPTEPSVTVPGNESGAPQFSEDTIALLENVLRQEMSGIHESQEIGEQDFFSDSTFFTERDNEYGMPLETANDDVGSENAGALSRSDDGRVQGQVKVEILHVSTQEPDFAQDWQEPLPSDVGEERFVSSPSAAIHEPYSTEPSVVENVIQESSGIGGRDIAQEPSGTVDGNVAQELSGTVDGNVAQEPSGTDGRDIMREPSGTVDKDIAQEPSTDGRDIAQEPSEAVADGTARAPSGPIGGDMPRKTSLAKPSAAEDVPVEAIEQEIAAVSEPEKPYVKPHVELLAKPSKKAGDSRAHLQETAMKLQQTLKNFGVNITITNISCGPSVTRYELQPESGVKVSKIVNLTDDIKLNLAAADIRMEAPIQGKAAIGIEVPNKETVTVSFRELVESPEFQAHPSKIAFAVGKDISGRVVVSDIAKMPHLLIAGATGSGKSVCINTIIMSILYKADPKEVKLIMIDPKVVELSIYNGIPHLLIPVVTDPKKAAGALNWAVAEMTDRYNKFAATGVRDMKGYNAKVDALPDIPGQQKPEKMAQIVIIVDELADLMMVASGDVEGAICRLAQLARAAGIHLIIATQRPSVNVITGLIKANMPSRIAFAVTSGIDSRTILDMVGAEKLLGKGDMLYSPYGSPKPTRVQGAFVSDDEVTDVVEYIKQENGLGIYNAAIEEKVNCAQEAGSEVSGLEASAGAGDGRDHYFSEAANLLIEKGKGSIGMLQRYFKIGFNRAARIMDQLEEAGVVGPEEGTKPRQVLMSPEQFEQFREESL